MSEPVLVGGQIVLVDWREDARPKEANKLRPAVVVEAGLFALTYPNAIVVPLTDDADLVIPELSLSLTPTEENGCPKACWAPAHLVTTVSKQRIARVTPSRIRPEQLTELRTLMADALGIATASSRRS